MKHLALALLAAVSLVCAACEHPVNSGGGQSGELQLRITAVGFGADAGPHEGVNRNTARTADSGYTTTFVDGDEIGITAVKNNAVVPGQANIPYKLEGGVWNPDTATQIRADTGTGTTYLVYYPYVATTMDTLYTATQIASAFIVPDDQGNHAKYAAADLMTWSGTVTGTTLTVTLAHKMALVEVSLPPGATAVKIKKDDTEIPVAQMWRENGVYRYIVKPGTPALSGEYTESAESFEWRHSPTLTAGRYERVSIEPPAGIRRAIQIASIDVPFRYVPSGSFQRDGTSSNITVISTGYWMAETQTTQELFTAVMGTNPSYFSDNTDSASGRGKLPVEQVNWYDAIAFCNKLSILDGKQPVYSVKVSGVEVDWANLTYNQIPTSGNTDWNAATMDRNRSGYRLPTEMEWMWAAIGADKTSQPNTTGYNKAFAGSNGTNAVDDYVWYTSNSGSKTHEVGKKDPNELGLSDMSGNVWEWCWDWYGSYESGEKPDPVGASSGSARVFRGGGWYNSADGVRPDYRNYYSPHYRYGGNGFRVVRP